MSAKSIRVPFFLVFVLFLLGLTLSVASAYNSSQGEGLRFCLSEECIRFAKAHFENSLWLLKSTLEVCVALATILGVYYALKTYSESIYSRVTRERADHFKVFCGFVESAPQEFRISMSLMQKRGLYFLIYPQADVAVFAVSVEYRKKLKVLEQFMERISKSFGEGGFDKRQHAVLMYEMFLGLYLEFEEPASRNVFEDEVRVCGFLDFINSSMPDLEIKLSGERHYRIS
ncbi:retron Ec48 family effector membrane protein [Pseudomonas sp. ZM23]|uniref:Retron Ec48 family effector membrane protein n=1 Tax=Pseudomonas triclosanedens TaxID=2961893 RepID=A0ABY6ZUR8_9PSED|nr:retron Ec48 family effector membrane protein [Pseudomonas triclosanedens]MCP8467206.1 retron Ec48 family effector membrane protein [Pseudomonas triclosanedens]MCP8472533.1 retron Ec48 family effector membrane protein [Pseudomonas triclosanedens]WAI47770.1 retron Ec48 family effector membrane protein [Pseudomonas triclosanedens]